MKTIDTCGPMPYSPLIPAVQAICEAQQGETLEIVTDQEQLFADLKEFLSEQGIGFREIYDREKMRLQFTK
ncbi:MAG: sulfurtransferase TusA family protein [Bacteroides sp.]